MSANPFDQASRYLAKLDPPAFFAWLLRLGDDRFCFRGWIDARQVRFPGDPDRTCDTVAFLEEVLQIAPDPEMFGRAMGYLGSLYLQERPSETRGDRFCVGIVVVNLTGRGNCSREMAWPEASIRTHLGVCERNLAEEDAAATLAAVATGQTPALVLPLIPLMRGGDQEGIIAEWLRLASAEADARRRVEYGGLALVFAEAADRWSAWKKALEGWQMIQSKQVLEWQAQEKAQTVIEMLEARFGTLPEELEAAIRRILEIPRLKKFVPLAVKADSLEQFRKDAQL
jgi:hypothetical protein